MTNQPISQQDATMSYTLQFKNFDETNPDAGGMICGFTVDGGHFIGDEQTTKWLCDERGIAPQLRHPDHGVCSVGFCAKEQKWYGWSHRAIAGFGVGSTVTKDSCAYTADTPEGLIEQYVDFHGEDDEQRRAKAAAECRILPDRSGIGILRAPLLIPMASTMVDAIDAISDPETIQTMQLVDLHGGDNAYVERKCGRGEWTAKTLDDAYQMACDFADDVS